jgi:ubiquinone/menaquinone biosynthesis C-methylase UbiE
MSVLADGIKSMGASNVKAVQGALTDTNLPDGSCDAIIVRLTYHHFSQPAEMAASLFRTLRPDGTLLMIEMPLVRMPNGDPDGIMPAVLLEQLQEAGFLHQRTVDPFNLAFASPLYLMVLRKP